MTIKAWYNSDGSRRRGTIPPWPLRQSAFIDQGHLAPADGVDNTGQAWRGTSRIIDRPSRRRENKRSWAKAKARSARIARGAS